MRRAAAAVALVAATSCGCGGPSQEPAEQGASTGSQTPGKAAPSEDAVTPEDAVAPEDAVTPELVVIVIAGDRVEPNGERVQVDAGEPVALVIDSDRPGELHVHSSPEQTFEVPAGSSEIEVTVETPGVVDVEEHESGVVVVRLEVR